MRTLCFRLVVSSFFFMAALCNRAGHYIFALWFLLSSSIFFFYLVFPNLSRRRLDVCHTSTHGVALVRIQDAGLKLDARGWLNIQDAKCRRKNRHLGTIAQICRAISSQLRHTSTIGKKVLSSNTSSTCHHNMVNFGPVRADIGPVVWGTPANFNGFRILAALLGIKCLDVVFLDNFDNKRRKVCGKVLLYKNCQRRSCSAINRLSSGVNILAGG